MTQALTSGDMRKSARLHNNHLFQAWLVLTLSIVFGIGLAAVHINLSGKIVENKRNESLERIPQLIWSGEDSANLMERGELVDILPGRIAVAKQERTVIYPVFQVKHKGEVAGWVVKAAGQGYSGRIELLLGLNPRGDTITGLFVLEQTETPGLGNKITFPVWLSQFTGRKITSPLVVVKGASTEAGGIDAITGATISSKAVVRIIKRTIKETQGLLTPAHIQFIERSF